MLPLLLTIERSLDDFANPRIYLFSLLKSTSVAPGAIAVTAAGIAVAASGVDVTVTLPVGVPTNVVAAASVGAAASAAVVTAPGLPASHWDGGAWDLISLPGASGSTIVSSIASLNGSHGTFAPQGTTPPNVADFAIGGNRGVQLTRAQFQCLRNDVCAAIFSGTNKTWGIAVDSRSTNPNDQIICAPGSSSSGSTRNFIEPHLAVPSYLQEHSAANGTTTFTSDWQQDFDYHRHYIMWDGTTGRWYVDGVLHALTSTAFDTSAIIMDQFAWGAGMSAGVASVGFEGFIRRLYLTSSPSTSDVAVIEAQWIAEDYTLPYSDSRTIQYATAGASIELGSNDEVNSAGDRATIANAIIANRWSLAAVGPIPEGNIPNRLTSSTSGTAAVAITNQVLALLGPRLGFAIMDMINGEINAHQTTQQCKDAFTLALTTIRMAAPNLPIVANTVRPYFETIEQGLTAAFNPFVPGLIAAVDAAFPGSPKIYLADYWACFGGVWNAIYYHDTNHPNHLGHTTEAPFLLGATNGDGDTLLALMKRLSVT